MYADLHLHTTASDGELTPDELVSLAVNKGFSAIAITDHDTTDGLEEAMSAGQRQAIEVIPGLELSTLDGDREIHLLGYYPECKNRALQNTLASIVRARNNRTIMMIEKLDQIGIKISLERVREIAQSDFTGRPHLARAMLEKGYIKTIGEAFNAEYLGRGGRAYVERFKLSPAEGISLLINAGAIPVLAHPGFLSQGEPINEIEIAELVEHGLRGIEVYYSRHREDQLSLYRDLSNKYDLLITGGSDFHGVMEALNHLGSIKLPYRYVELLKKNRV